MRVSSANELPATSAAPLPSDPAKAAEAFEAWFIGFLAEEMQDSVGGGPLSGGAANVFSDFFTQEIGRRTAEGGGIGLADQVRGALENRMRRQAGGGPEGGHGGDDMPGQAPMRVTSGFGMRTHPIDGGLRQHDGIDVAAPVGTPVTAPRDGVVRFAGARGGYGNVIVLDHGDGEETRYAHCDTVGVKVGQVVRAGEALATVGSTGHSTGPHLHFELRTNGHAVDPRRDVTKVLGGFAEAETRGAQPSTSSVERP